MTTPHGAAAARVADALAQGHRDALARRAAALQGLAQQLIHARLATLPAPPAAPDEAARTEATPAIRPLGPIGTLLAGHAQRVRPAPPPLVAAAPDPKNSPTEASPGEPTALAWFRNTWSRLSTAQRLAESQAHLPSNAGPLNAEHLAHRALLVMNEASPDCLRHFMAQLDTLFWLDGVNRG